MTVTETEKHRTGTASTHGLRRVYAAQLIGATIDGFALTVAVLYFTIQIGLAAQFVGAVLAVGALAALLLAPVLGAVTDRIGLGRSAIVYSVLGAGALGGYAVAAENVTYAIAAVLFLIGQAGLAAVRQALVAASVPAGDRVRARAVMHTLLNAGMGFGAVFGAAVLALGARPVFVACFGIGAGVMLAGTVLFVGLPRRREVGSGPRPSGIRLLLAIRDRRFLAVTCLATILQLTMPILSVLLPVWVAERTSAPTWVGATLLGINTVLVMGLQTTVAARARSATSAARTATVAAGCLATACLLIGVSGGGTLTPTAATVLLVAAVLVLTVGEMNAGAASWRAAFNAVPAGADGQYQAVFGMASSGARIIGPALALPLVLHTGLTGWGVLAVAVFLAAVALGAMLRREAGQRHE